jgi:hypothetical protein
MLCEEKVVNAEMDSYGGKLMKGYWKLTLECGHKCMGRTHKNSKAYPHDKFFCAQCWAKL